jgi:hypothetical protein
MAVEGDSANRIASDIQLVAIEEELGIIRCSPHDSAAAFQLQSAKFIQQQGAAAPDAAFL